VPGINPPGDKSLASRS